MEELSSLETALLSSIEDVTTGAGTEELSMSTEDETAEGETSAMLEDAMLADTDNETAEDEASAMLEVSKLTGTDDVSVQDGRALVLLTTSSLELTASLEVGSLEGIASEVCEMTASDEEVANEISEEISEEEMADDVDALIVVVVEEPDPGTRV